jgi:hypothetical protein
MDGLTQSDIDRWQSRLSGAVRDVAAIIRESKALGEHLGMQVLPEAIVDLMTELWDQGFSQTQIREAFLEAIAAMPRYAAGEEVRT